MNLEIVDFTNTTEYANDTCAMTGARVTLTNGTHAIVISQDEHFVEFEDGSVECWYTLTLRNTHGDIFQILD